MRVADHLEHGWCVFGHGQGNRVVGIAKDEQAATEFAQAVELFVQRGCLGRLQRTPPPAAARQGRQGVEGRLRRAESAQQRMESNRTDILSAGEPQAVEPFSLRQIGHGMQAMAIRSCATVSVFVSGRN